MKYFLYDAAWKTQHFTRRHQLICDFATEQLWYFWKPTVSIIIQKHFGQLQNFQKFFKCLESIRIWQDALYTKNHGNEGKVKHGRKQKLVHVYLTCLHRPWREKSFGEIGSFYRPVWELERHMHHCERIRDQLTYPCHRVKLCKFVFIRNLSCREDLGQSDPWRNGLLRRKNEKRLDKETKHCSFFATSYETYQSNGLVHISKSRPAIRCVKIELSQVGPSCRSSVAFGKSTWQTNTNKVFTLHTRATWESLLLGLCQEVHFSVMDKDCPESAFTFTGGNRYNLPPVAPLVTALKQKLKLGITQQMWKMVKPLRL